MCIGVEETERGWKGHNLVEFFLMLVMEATHMYLKSSNLKSNLYNIVTYLSFLFCFLSLTTSLDFVVFSVHY